jgi:hypothetical protein
MLKKLLLGFGLPLIVILCNGIVAWRLVGLSYGHFTWEAFAQVYTPTPIPLGLGLSCATDTQCGSGFCVSGVCCINACTGPNQTCTAPGSAGFCTARADAPALSVPLLWTLVLLLVAFGAFSIRRTLSSHRRTE